MKLTATVNTINGSSSLKAFATLIIDGLLAINGFKVIEGSNGLFVSPPSTKSNKPGEDGKDKYYDDVRYLDMTEENTSELRDKVSEVILETYKAKAGTSTRAKTASTRASEPAPTNGKPAMSRVANW